MDPETLPLTVTNLLLGVAVLVGLLQLAHAVFTEVRRHPRSRV